MEALHAEVGRIRAERIMDGAESAVYPHVGKGAATLWQSWEKRARRAVAQAQLFSWNGLSMGVTELRRRAVQAFGGMVRG